MTFSNKNQQVLSTLHDSSPRDINLDNEVLHINNNPIRLAFIDIIKYI